MRETWGGGGWVGGSTITHSNKTTIQMEQNYHVQHEHTDLLRNIELTLIILADMHSKIKVAMLNLYQMKTFHSLKAADSSSGSSSSSPPSPSLKYQHDDVCVPLVPWS